MNEGYQDEADGYHDPFMDQDPDGCSDVSDIDEVELEVQLYSQIHYQVDQEINDLSGVKTIVDNSIKYQNSIPSSTKSKGIINDSPTPTQNDRGSHEQVNRNDLKQCIENSTEKATKGLKSKKSTMQSDTSQDTKSKKKYTKLLPSSDMGNCVIEVESTDELHKGVHRKRPKPKSSKMLKVVVELDSESSESVKSYISVGSTSPGCDTLTVSDSDSGNEEYYKVSYSENVSQEAISFIKKGQGSSDNVKLNINNPGKLLKNKRSISSIKTTESIETLITSDSENVSQEFISLMTDVDGMADDIQVHVNDPETLKTKRKLPLIQNVITQVNIEDPSCTLEDIHNSLPDCDWSIIPRDVAPKFKTLNRYYKPLSVKCNNCNERGHLSKICPHPRKLVTCGLCGKKGHNMRSCHNLRCYNCHMTGHAGKECTERRRKLWEQCFTCQMQGHVTIECPNRWRQFHATTDSNQLQRGDNEENTQVYCSNCGKEGHFHHDCLRDMMDKRNRPTWPFIACYDLKKEYGILLRKRKEAEIEHEKADFFEEDEIPQSKKQKKNGLEPRNTKRNRSYNDGYFGDIYSDNYTVKYNRWTEDDNGKRGRYQERDNDHWTGNKRKRQEGSADRNRNKKLKLSKTSQDIPSQHSFIQSALEAKSTKKKKRPNKSNKGNKTPDNQERKGPRKDWGREVTFPRNNNNTSGSNSVKGEQSGKTKDYNRKKRNRRKKEGKGNGHDNFQGYRTSGGWKDNHKPNVQGQHQGKDNTHFKHTGKKKNSGNPGKKTRQNFTSQNGFKARYEKTQNYRHNGW